METHFKQQSTSQFAYDKKVITKNTKSLTNNVILNFIKTLMGIIFPLITFPYSSRILTPTGIGKVNFSQSIISFFGIIASLGIVSYGIRNGAEVRDNKEELSKFSKELFSINMISTIIAYLLLGVCLAFVSKLMEYRKLLIICSATILFTTLGMDWLYSALEEFEYITIRSILFQVVSIILLFVFVKTEDDYYKYAAISVGANVGSNICNFIHSRKFINLFIKTKIELRKHLKSIFVLFALAVASTVYTVLDSIMLGFFSCDYEVGLYSAATKINRLVLSLTCSLGIVFLPRLSYYKLGNNDNAAFLNLIYKSFEIIIMFATPATFGLCILCEPILLILCGPEYSAASNTMRIMNPIIIIVGLSNLTGVQLFVPLKKEKWTLDSVIAGAIVNFILNFILIPIHGAFGAAIASITAESTVTIVQLYFARRVIQIRKILQLLSRHFLLSSIMCIPVISSLYFFNSQILQCIVGITCGTVVYIWLLFITKNTIFQTVLNKFFRRCK